MIADAIALLDSLYASGDLSVDQHAGIMRGFLEYSRMVGEQNTTIGYQDAMIAEYRKTLNAAYHGLMSYACGNSAPALAEEMAAEISRVLGKEPSA